MNKQLSELIKVDLALEPQTFASNANENTEYFSLSKYGKALFAVTYEAEGVIAAEVLLPTDDITIAVFEAEDVAGTGVQALDDPLGVAYSVDVAGCVNATEAIIHLTAVSIAADEFTINGTTFVWDALGYDVDDRPLNWVDRDDALDAINAHFDNVTAVAGVADSIRLTSPDGNTGITVSEVIDDGGSFAGTVKAVGYVEVDASRLSDGFSAVRLNIDNDTATATAVMGAVCIRGDGRYTPQQAVGNSLSIV